jgi:hypothetical protein
MIDLITEAFPEIDNCLSVFTAKHSFVYEDNELKKGVFVSDFQPKHLHIENKTNSNFHFIQNDDCIMNNVKGGQCDYVIFNSKDFHFVDVKVAKDNFANHRKTAYSQIENTFKYYSNKIDFPENCLLYGLVCFPSKRRIIKSSESTKRKEFKIKYKIDLKIGNYILFE